MRINNIIRTLPPIQLHNVVQIFLTLAVSLFTLRLGVGLFAWRAANVLEKPNYTVVKRLPSSSRGFVEVRKYEPYLIAETTVDESSMRKAGGKGFGKCAGVSIYELQFTINAYDVHITSLFMFHYLQYIFGKNEARKGNESEKMVRRYDIPCFELY